MESLVWFISSLCVQEKEEREKQITVTAGPFWGIISNYSYRRASAGELILHYITVGPFPGIRNVILFAFFWCYFGNWTNLTCLVLFIQIRIFRKYGSCTTSHGLEKVDEHRSCGSTRDSGADCWAACRSGALLVHRGVCAAGAQKELIDEIVEVGFVFCDWGALLHAVARCVISSHDLW